MPIGRIEGSFVVTIEGLSRDRSHPVQQAFAGVAEPDGQVTDCVPQCGYCIPGMIMAVAQLLKDKPKPTDADIDREITNICRCGTFQQVREAIHMAANA